MNEQELGRNKFILKLSDTLTLFLILIFLVIFFTVMDKSFFSLNNMNTIMRNVSVSGIIALALTPLMIARGLDISFGASISFTGVIMAVLYKMGVPLIICLIVVLLIATFIGFFNGILIESFSLPPLIFTLGMMSILNALALVTSGAFSIGLLTPQLYYFGTKSFIRIPFVMWLLIVFILIFWFILTFTKTGRTVYILGSNPKVAFLTGIKVKKIKILLYTFTGFIVGVASIIMISMSGVGNPFAGAKMTLPILSAVLLGGISLAGGKGNMWNTLLGVIIISVIFNGLSILNVSSYYIQIIQGFALVLVVGIYEVRSLRAARR